jgi:polyisoprenoid-binding protein YceI
MLTRRLKAVGAIAFLLGAISLGAANPVSAATAKAGKACTKSGQKSGSLTCTRVNGKLVWRTTSKATTTVKKATETTVAASGGGSSNAAAANEIEGTWKPTSSSVVGYRMKEVLQGQATEGVGRTNAVKGSLVIKGTTVTSAEFIADMTTLKSDEVNRDRTLKDRYLETDKFKEAKLTLKAPIELGSVPADTVVIKRTVPVSLTLHGVTKEISIDLDARRNRANIEVLGSIKIALADYNIERPNVAGTVTVDPEGLLEFLIVLEK